MSGANEVSGIVFDIQRYSLHDGPGLRTNVFLKGCSLDCAWCSNPEAKDPLPQIAFFEERCFLCDDCLEVCPAEAIELRDGRLRWHAEACRGNHACQQECARVCPAQAFRLIGAEMSAAEVAAAVRRDTAFYGGQGGLTLTGGEPTFQPQFAEAILQCAQAEGLHTAIETCGACAWAALERLLPRLNLVLFDLKHLDAAIHRQYTGGDNLAILDNLRRTAATGIEVVVRVPLVPGFNTDSGSLEAMAEFIQSIEGASSVHLLPYHTLGRAKYRALGMNYIMEEVPPMSTTAAEALAAPFWACGLDVSVGG
jgi:pyruvate formate lyase activating enzyme